MSWKLVAFAPKPIVQAALATHEAIDEWDPEVIITGGEITDERPNDWVLEAYFEHKPRKADLTLIAGLFADGAPKLVAEELPDTDWVSETQKQIEPIRAGRFYVHTPDHEPDWSEDVIDFSIPAAQAFGTGQHSTTAGCLEMLDAMKRRGVVVRNLADIGTGTGLLAFAAMALWPGAKAIASDVDPICEPVVVENALLNSVPLGTAPGTLAMVVAEGMDDALLAGRAPYDLVIANILAGPLIELAGDFGDAVAPHGSVLLAGLLETQEPAVRAAYRTAGFRLAARLVNGDWSILWLRRRPI
ncbi:50S ribosomal protein L11 methyltransferase [Altererythrobacter sp. Root672]|uniref:50S ribosomal protein L11 methyltransferase n=1 Tax=Altererythrobacter sp. Root672 TaxID=1736584 RepID=UPI0006F7FD77|nr:50S ribosomal protein L11 methyltransferase [Altererythrobacter sp. Root672]KRA83162.1 ribonucleotide-diphosphate reductase subunit beta [Altererythrobacter sp. Root672]